MMESRHRQRGGGMCRFYPFTFKPTTIKVKGAEILTAGFWICPSIYGKNNYPPLKWMNNLYWKTGFIPWCQTRIPGRAAESQTENVKQLVEILQCFHFWSVTWTPFRWMENSRKTCLWINDPIRFLQELL